MFTVYGVKHQAGKRMTERIGTCATAEEAASMIDGALCYCDQAYAKDDSGTVQMLKMSADFVYPALPLDPEDRRTPPDGGTR